ncbi:hypothetical protein P3T76_005670 [Phytophthora citrophthora]|uniref:Uncharacterized protein n=1 Tax=Phytophthora citrophthora TaxID=4793 RepID=A0AAD9GRQ8_9STRA|nr:hypothetical protein P3T76_005670 [Phytophthora citrophthora]
MESSAIAANPSAGVRRDAPSRTGGGGDGARDVVLGNPRKTAVVLVCACAGGGVFTSTLGRWLCHC